jgi:hypothetical protein
MRSALSLLVPLLVLTACQQQADLLAEQKAACKELADKKELRAGLTIDECAKQLKAAAEASDPVRKAEERVQKLAALVLANKGSTDFAKQQEVRDARLDVERLGRPAVAPLQARLKGSQDPAVRVEVARVLVRLCADECKGEHPNCLVPALLEGIGKERPVEVRAESFEALATCTGKTLGQDEQAWRSWWAGQAQP